ncbi:MAG TPA: hypothetical protein DEB06_07800 [Phycisphaerales bacterium]|nr:hypothetical protein [Phycisphaerales bacterium]
MPSSNVCWGIEVGAGAIKALKLEKDADSLRVADFVVIPHKKVLSTPDIDRDDATRVALGALMSQYRDAMRGAAIAVSLPGHSTFARFAKLPPVEPKGVANLVRFEAVQQIPFPIEEVEWDYQTFQSEDSPDVEVGIFACTKERIAERLAVYEEVGLVPDIFSLSPVAVYNAIAYDLGFTPRSPGTVILDIGTTATDLIITDHGKVWIRTFPLGGHNFTQTLEETFKLAYGKAEKLKREAETSKYKRHIFQAMKPVLSELVQDIQRSISYFQETHPESNIQRLIGVGATFKLLGLRKILSQQLQMEVFRLEQFKRLSVEGSAAADFEAATPTLATAYGMALQGLGLNFINANLMPVSVVRKAMWKRKTPWLLTAAGLGIAAGGVSFLRPFLDNAAMARARADNSIQRPINETISLGNRLKSEWQEASAAAQPGMMAQNLLALTDGRGLYTSLLEDVDRMLSAARVFRSPGKPDDTHAVEIKSLDTEYLAPESPLVAQTAAGSGGSDSPAPTTPESGAADLKAGPRGAVRMTLVFDSNHPDRQAFANDTVLAWLRSNATRMGIPYTLEAIPGPAAVRIDTIVAPPGPTPTAPTGGGRRPPPPPPSAPGGRPGGFGGRPRPDDDGGIPLGGTGGGIPLGGGSPSRPSPPGSPPERGSGDSRGQSSLESLAPFPERLIRKPLEGPVYRYSVIWYAQVRDPATEAVPDPSAVTQEPDA